MISILGNNLAIIFYIEPIVTVVHTEFIIYKQTSFGL